jgi:hypothetical protein
MNRIIDIINEVFKEVDLMQMIDGERQYEVTQDVLFEALEKRFGDARIEE